MIPLSNRTLGVLDDNNYPFSSARVTGEPDPNEFIVIRVDEPLFDRHGDVHNRRSEDQKISLDLLIF